MSPASSPKPLHVAGTVHRPFLSAYFVLTLFSTYQLCKKLESSALGNEYISPIYSDQPKMAVFQGNDV